MIKKEKTKGAKYKQCFQEMLEENDELFKKFRTIHNKFKKDPKENRTKFNEVGEEVTAVIKKYETILCGRSEGSGFGNYSQNLSDMFWSEIRNEFSEIDEIGML